MAPRRAAPADRTDADLVALSRAGDRQAFGELMQRYQDRVYSLAYRLIGDREEAADAAQDAFLNAYRALGSFRGESAFYTWLFRIAVNAARSRQRRMSLHATQRSLDAPGDANSQRANDPVSALRAVGPDPAEEAGRAERKRLVEEALARLDADQRALIVLRDLEGKNYAEIAELLDCPRGTVKSRLHRARMALRELLAPVIARSSEVGA